jgi:hypothetical protein
MKKPNTMSSLADERVDERNHKIFHPIWQERKPAVQHDVVDLREDVLEVLDESRAENRAEQRTCAAQYRHQHDLARRGPLHPFGAREWVH